MTKTLIQLAQEEAIKTNKIITAIKVEGKLKELSDTVVEEGNIEFITTETKIGIETYRRSVIMLMLSAIHNMYPKDNKLKVYVQYSVSKGVYCEIKGDFEVTQEFLDNLKVKMLDYVAKDIPINKMTLKTSEAVKLFEKYGMDEKVKLFKYRTDSYISVYELDGYNDYYYGYMMPSTKSLGIFELYKYSDGFVLQLPVKEAPYQVPEFAPQNKVSDTLHNATKWAEMMEMHTVGDINQHIIDGNINSMMLVLEAKKQQDIISIVNQIKEHKGVKFIMIAGPSSSGKTTFSHKLSIQLRASGFKPHTIGVDDYFVEREQTPKDENGNYNFEDIEAIDIELFNRHMTALLNGEEVDMPTFNFKKGCKEYLGNKIKMGKDDILVIEGIHCLNDKLSYSLPVESKFKIYISALTQLNIDEHNRVTSTDVRLIRRMVRDLRTRGASPTRTLDMWESVRKGEEKNIFPYQECADVVVNSAMSYELFVLKHYVEPLLYSVSEDDPEYYEAKRLLKFLKYFLSCSSEFVPMDSVLREFVGGGCFKI